jgi:hypothetical protein
MYTTDVTDFTPFFESVESKDDPRTKLLRIKQDSGLKSENVFLVESKWPTQRLVLQGKYPLRLIMITQKHAKWMLGFARQHNIPLVPPGTTLEEAIAKLSIESENNNNGSSSSSSSSSSDSSVASATTRKSNAGKPLKVFLVSEEVMEGISFPPLFPLSPTIPLPSFPNPSLPSFSNPSLFPLQPSPFPLSPFPSLLTLSLIFFPL